MSIDNGPSAVSKPSKAIHLNEYCAVFAVAVVIDHLTDLKP